MKGCGFGMTARRGGSWVNKKVFCCAEPTSLSLTRTTATRAFDILQTSTTFSITKTTILPAHKIETMSTASKWFVPTQEYLASVEDYAMVGYSALYVKNHFIDEPSTHGLDDLPTGSEPNFADVLDHPMYYQARLVYADVDRDNKDHQRACKDAVKPGFMVQESEKIKAAKKKLFEHVIDHKDHCGSLASESGDEDESPEDEDMEKRLAAMGEAFERSNRVTHSMIDYVLKLESEADRREVLTIISRQHRRKNPRPVLLLIGMIDKFSEGVKEGWRIGYDFYANNLMIKPYHATDVTQHPLAEKWDVELPDDGVSWKGHPAGFVTDKLLPLQEEFNQDKDNKLEKEIKNETYGFKLLAYHSITRWLRNHWKLLADIKTVDGAKPLEEVGLHDVTAIYYSIMGETEEVPFPYKAQDKEKHLVGTMPTLKHMQVLLEDYERSVRHDALEAKQAGKEDVAQNVANLYEHLLEQLRSFNLNPEKPL